MATVSTLTFDLVANSAKLQQGLAKGTKSIQKFGKDARKQLNDVGKKFAFAAAAGTSAFVALGIASAKTSRELVNSARVAGEGLEKFQALSLASKEYGIEQEKLGDILKDTQDRVGDFLITGGGPMLDFFEEIAPKIGVTAQQFKGLSGSEALQLYHDSLVQANVSQEEMVFFMEAMASDATQLLPLLKQGADGIAEYARKAEILGLNLSDIDAAQLELMNKSISTGQQALEGLGRQVALKISPFIQDLADEFLNVAKEAGGVGEIVNKSFDVALKAIGIFADGVRGLQIVWKGATVLVAGFVSTLITGIAKADQALTAFMNLIPGVNATVSTTISNLNESFRTAYDENLSSFKESLMEPLPSQSIETWVADVQSKAQESAKKLVEQNGGIGENLIGGAGSNTGDLSEEEKYLDGLKKFESVTERYAIVAKNAGATIEDAFARAGDAAVGNLADGLAQAIVAGEDLNDVFDQVAKTLITSVISSLIQVGVQMLITKALGTTLRAAETAETIAMASAASAAWAPAAAGASLATVGSNAIPAATALTTTYGLSAGLAGVAHDGMDMIPREGTYLLDKGERVVPSDQNERMTKALEGSAANGKSVSVTNVYQIQSNDPAAVQRAVERMLPASERRTVAAVEAALLRGGSLSRAAGVR